MKNEDIFITTMSQEEYEALSEREKSLYDAGKERGIQLKPVYCIFIWVCGFITALIVVGIFRE